MIVENGKMSNKSRANGKFIIFKLVKEIAVESKSRQIKKSTR
jgi:hypothetical protein